MITRLLGRVWKLPPSAFAVDEVECLPVPMRDGVPLVTQIYRPRSEQNLPTILMRTPYGRGSPFGQMARLFAGQGYTIVVQSVRGTFGSGGQFNPFFQERDDGVDTVTWIEQQPWYQGKLGLWGASYLGFVEWAIAADLGDRLSALSNAMTPSDFHASIYEGGGFRLQDYATWISGVASQEQTSVLMRNLKQRLFGDPHKNHYTHLPLATIDKAFTGKEIGFWRGWLEHEDPADPFWEPLQNRRRMADVTAPVSMVAGWSDFFIPVQIADFKAMKALGKSVRLKVGPWTHSNFQSVGEGIRDALEWFDIHLKGHGRPPEVSRRILFWLNGADEWREMREWPSSARRLGLGANGHLAADDSEGGDLTFTYDPTDPTPSLEGAKLASKTGRGDMTALAARADVLVFNGPKLDRQLELLGDVSVTLTTSATSPHHDLFFCLCDVGPDGKSINVTDGYRRLFPASGDAARRTTTIEGLAVAWRLEVGHHLQLLVAAGAFPRYARNLGLGQPLATATDTRTVNITVYCGADASFISI